MEDVREQNFLSYRRYWIYELGIPGTWGYTPFVISETNNLPAANGYYKSIQSERDGKFTPGVYRTNPVMIKSAMCSSVQGLIQTRDTGSYGCSPWTYRGDLCHFNVTQVPPLWDNGGFGVWNDRLASYSFNKASAKLMDADADVALMIAELRETLAMLKNPLKALTSAWTRMVKEARRKKVNPTAPLLDILSGGWLTYRYGFLPLISDINALIVLYNEKLVQSIGMGRRKAGTSETDTKVFDFPSGGTSSHWTTRVTVETTIKSSTHLYFQQLLEAAEIYKLRTLGFHWSNLPALFWETTTLSFVVDWALAVGDWLRAIMPNANLSMLGNCTSQKHTVKAKAECVSLYPAVGYKDLVVEPSYWNWESNTLIRRVELVQPVLPAFTFDVLNVKRALDSLSLLWQPVSQQLRRAKYASKR